MLQLKWTEEIKQTLQIPKKIKRNHQTSKSNGHCASLLIHSYMGIHPHMIQNPPNFKTPLYHACETPFLLFLCIQIQYLDAWSLMPA
jgi:hypothetical protein